MPTARPESIGERGSYIEISAELHAEVELLLAEGKERNFYPPNYAAADFIKDAVRLTMGIPAHALAGALALVDELTRDRVISARLSAGLIATEVQQPGGGRPRE